MSESNASEILKALFELLLSHVEEGVHIVDQRGVTIYYNKAASRIEGLSPSEVVGRPLLEVFPSLTEEESTIYKVLKTGEPIYERLQTFTNYKGKKITTINSTLPVKVGSRVMGAIEISRDVTSVKSMSERIADLEALLYNRPAVEVRKKRFFRHTLDDIVGESRAITELKKLAAKVAKSSVPVLVWGETGTGKELFVQAIHNESPRKDGPFIPQDCAALPGTLLENVLFGTVRGSFSGAKDRPGLFELAHEGTLFLDEIDAMPLELQAKLLRVLQDRIIRRVGDTKEHLVDVRVIAACIEDPVEAVEKGKLREDLFYRLNVVTLRIPPLRERKEDIPLLVEHFIKKFSKEEVKISKEVMDIFMEYSWPGNVRELENAIEGALVVMDGDEIRPEHLPLQIRAYFSPKKGAVLSGEHLNLNEALGRVESELIKKAIRESKGNVTRAARMLGIPRQTLQYKLRKLRGDGITKN
ncbi:sigma 54-interacting transcriptional regulator [Thermovorax subterraneus]|jgi:arginine utilization regulatory protein|nr:sigma 54-interacting transcriptional regulator [Thermovorax subterraneus]